MTPDGPVGHDNDEEATAAAAAAAIVSGAATSTASTAAGTSTITSTHAVADAAAAPRPVSSPAHEPEAAASTTTTTAAAAAANSASDNNTSHTDSTITTPAAVTATAPVPSIASSAAATADSEPVQHPPLSSQDNSEGQQQRQTDEQQLQALQVNGNGNGNSRLPENNSDAAESESDMSNHRTGLPASVHHLNHHNHSHHHHSHSLSTGYPTTTSTGASALYSASASLSSTQYAASYPTVTSATALTADPFRVSPVASTQMPLPSMRTIDAISQQGQSPVVSPLPHHSMSMSMTMPLVAVSASPQYYSAHSLALPSNYTLAQDLAQHPLPPHDPRLLNHRGPKKEIKRRTKTGCLTCRKRRIKCDETHPTCNNCRKSKRECLGYDPIFRQQTIGQTGNTIQPAPGSLPPSPQAPIATSAYPSPSLTQVVASRIGNSYSSQPPILSSVYAPTPASTIPSPTSSTIPAASISYHSSPTVKTESNTDFSAVKLEGTYDYPASNLDRSIRQLPTPASVDTRHLNSKPGHLSEIHYPRANKMKIREIIDLLGPPASPQQISHTEETFHEITKVYHEMYAPGLSAFFESRWYYFTENGKMSFPKDLKLIEHMATFLKILEGVKANDHSQIAVSGALETRIVWELACTAYQTPERTNPMRISLPPDNDAAEARNRLQVVEALLCGDYLSTNLLSPPVSDNDHHRIRQFDFWYSLGEFVRKQDNPHAPINVKSREDTLSRMRHLLDGRENRDVLYSIAVVRELAPGFDPEYGNTIPQHLDESDPKNRLAVASKFIMDESQVSGGTTNVVRRFSDIASRAYVNPGVNIARRI